MKNYLNFETDIKNLENELEKLKDPFNQEGLSEVDTKKISKTQEEIDETPDVEHPLVRTHEDTGRKSFYFNANRTDRIVGWGRDESDALLDEIYMQITAPKYQYHHEWQVGDLLLWDNRCLVHSVNVDYPVGQKRLHQRILLKGQRPV